MGYKYFNIPGGYKEVSIPMFVNESMQVGAEVYFTNELKNQFYRSRIAEVSSQAEVDIVGKIRSIHVNQTNFFDKVLTNSVLTSAYVVTVRIDIKLIRKSDKKIVWETAFSDSRPFDGARLTSEGVTASNVIYNQSGLERNLKGIAEIMMSQAHSQLTENF